MEERLERKILSGAPDSRIRALAVIRQSVDELYEKIHRDIIDRYFTDKIEIDGWNSLRSEDKIENLPTFLESLKGRWPRNLAYHFCPTYLNPDIAEQVILKTLKMAVCRGDLDIEIAATEYRYRRSIGSFLVSIDIVERLGHKNFVLYDPEREIYYPTKVGRTLLAMMGGYASMRRSQGIHGLSQDQRIINAQNAGKQGGAASLQNRSGYHAQTLQQRRQFGKQGALASGRILWDDKSIDYLVSLAANPRYRFPEYHTHRGAPNWQKITDELNSRYKTQRTVTAVRIMYRRFSRQQFSLFSD